MSFSVSCGQFQPNAATGTVEGVEVCEDGRPVLLVWNVFDGGLYGAEQRAKAVRETRKIVLRQLRITGSAEAAGDALEAIGAGFCTARPA